MVRWHCGCSCHFYPRSPCGERRIASTASVATLDISIHALLAESDPLTTRHVSPLIISIHALLAESDRAPGIIFIIFDYFYPRSPCGERLTGDDWTNHVRNFYPRSPCGERHAACRQYFIRSAFLSTLSLRRATIIFCKLFHGLVISIHALLAESDQGQQLRHQ